MTKGLVRSLARGGVSAANPIFKQRYAIEKTIVITNGGAGWGTAVIGDIPAGVFRVLGAEISFDATKGDADMTDTWDGDFSVGTTATADATLSLTDINVVPSTATVTAVAGVSEANYGVSSTTQHNAAFLDNSDGAMELNLNVIVDDTSISADSSVAVVGHLDLVLLYI